MSDITEGLGAAIEGALAGRAVEPRADERNLDPTKAAVDGLQHEGDCPNCGTQTVGPHCHNCGQKRVVHRSLTAIGHDLLHGVLHLDGKFWNTLPLLAFKPGKLTRRYIEGERAKFVSPMAMFLFSVFAMFAIFQMAGISAPGDLDPETNFNEAAQSMRAETQDSRDKLAATIEQMSPDDPERAQAEAELEQFDKSLEAFEEVEKLEFNDTMSMSIEPTGIEAFDEGLVKKWRENPSLMIYKLQNNAYKFSWLLIPLSLPFMWLLFAWKRRFKVYDHAIFVTYSLAFMSMLFIVASLLGVFGAPTASIVFPLLFIPPLHIYKQLRGAYDLGRFGAAWRLLALSIFIWIVIVLFLQVLIMIGAF